MANERNIEPDPGQPMVYHMQMVAHLPDYTLVLDIIHATEYLWDTANAG